jgi:hypothetical protein
MSGNTTMSYTSNATVQGGATQPMAAKEYPICQGAVQDSCINPREAGKNFGNRPLKHWPGKPASES